ncbi:alpha-xylosidase [Paenibacillus sp. y28]|uniref:alpha-xylosidase n=1 Tax=Paenibacillus sp. y28 TaxID=3129110 RepID=UPI003018A1DC
MKISDGNWLIRQGLQVLAPVQAHDFEMDSRSVTVYASPRPIADRSGMLDTMLLTVRFSSPMPDVIRVQLFHHQGVEDHGPAFELEESQAHPVQISEAEESVALASGGLTVRIRKGSPWAVDFLRDGRRITGSGFKGMGYVKSDTGTAYMREELDLGVGEYVYGLGERFTPFVKNGQVVDTWNKDGGTSTEQAYKNIPFYVTNKGYGVFVNHPEQVSFEVASEKVSKTQFSVEGESLDYYILNGPTMKEVLNKYTALTGKPALPPAWTFGLWLTTSFTTNYDETTVNSFIDGMAERDLPLHVFHFDCFWMREFHWCDFEWDKRVFPDPAGMLQRLKDKGLKICVWINPYIAQRSHMFTEGKKLGYLIKKPNGDVWQWDLWQPGMGVIDFTNPAAVQWFQDKLRGLVDMGVDSFKTDFGERIPTDVVYYDGSDPFKMHNYYTFLYNKAVFEVLEEKLGKNEAAVFARSATVGGQQFPVHWGGDCYATYESMAESLRGGLSLGLSGFGFWSHDIGGFENTATADVYKRWLAFGLLSSHSRLHGSKSYRVPWVYDEEAVDVTRFFTKLKCSLMPYLFDAAVQATEQGIPAMRAMVLEFGDDPNCDYLDRQYMLGGDLLVAPVFNEEGIGTYYLPRGTWTHFLTGQTREGGTWVKEQVDYMSIPLYVRPNSLIAVGADNRRPDYDFAEGVELQLFALEDGQSATATVRSMQGTPELQVTAARNGRKLTISAEGAGKRWSVLLRGVSSPVSAVKGGSASAEQAGTRLTPDSLAAAHIELEL